MKTFTVSIIFIAIAVIFVVQTEAEEGLVLHLSFDKNTIQNDKAKDQSGKGNDGIINGKLDLVAGKYGDAMLFNGIDNFVEVPLTDSITFTKGSSFSIQAWVKTDDSPAQNDGIVGNYRQSTEALWMLSVSGDDAALRGKMGFSLRDKGKVHSAGVRSEKFLNDDTWHHLAGVRDQKAKKLRFYVDGELIGEVDDATEEINSGQSIWVGEHLNRFYKGAIDEVKVWNKPLTAAELDKSRQGLAVVSASAKLATCWGLIK